MNEQFSKLRQVSDAGLAVAIMLLLTGLFCIPAFSRQPASADTPHTITVRVSSAIPNISEENRSYSLEGAGYAVFSDYECTQQMATIVTTADGTGTSPQLPAGRYYLRQVSAPTGYVLSDELLQADVEIDRDASVNARITPDYASADLLLFESNAETLTTAPTAAGRFADAQFTLAYYDSTADSSMLLGPTRSWVFRTDTSGEIHLSADYLQGGSPFYTNGDGSPVLPLGRYVFSSTEYPLGFTLASESLSEDVSSSETAPKAPSAQYSPIEAHMQVIRGDFMFRKVDEYRNPMAGIPFLLSYSNGEPNSETESHVIVTDANGDFSSDAARIAHSEKTNGNDAAVTLTADGDYTVDSTLLDANCGIWFSADHEGQTSAADDAHGALPYGTYRLRELACDANMDKNLVTTQFTVFKDGFTVKLDNIVNTTPSISTSVQDGADGDKLLRPRDNATISATIAYQNLVPGTEYRLFLSLIDTGTGEDISSSDDSTGVSETVFTPQEKDGTLTIEIPIDASGYAGCELMVLDELHSSTGMTITSAKDNEPNQTIEVEPIITAYAYDSIDEDKYVMGQDAIIAERIDYTGLKQGSPYKMTSMLVDKATGNAVRDSQGEAISVSTQLTPDTADGSTTLELPVNASVLEGHDLVVFNQISSKSGRLVANMQDIDDEAQTVKTVKLTTNATDKQDGDKLFDGASSEVHIIDRVKYANLEPGRQYKISGVLMNKETGTALLINDKEVTASRQFVPDEINGSIEMDFEFDANAHTSDVLVVFETLTCDDKVIAKHTDLNDVAQTVTREDIDPDSPAQAGVAVPGTGASSAATSSNSMPKTGDEVSRVLLVSIVAFCAVCICIAYAAHRRAVTMSALRRNRRDEEL